MKQEKPAFKDHFSGHAGDYAAHRPGYPPALFDWLADQSPGRSLAWDCATGNGQAAVALAEHFERVVASDASTAQIAQAAPHPRVEYRIEPAEHSSLAPASVDLLTVAQAFHWFDHEAFHGEADRVLRPQGIVAVWAYPLARIDDRVDPLVFDLYERRLGEYWPPERRFIERGYSDFALPWPEVAAPSFEMTARWTLDALIGYLGTWSALRRCVAEDGHNPLKEMEKPLAEAWGDPGETKLVRWPLILKVCRKPV